MSKTTVTVAVTGAIAALGVGAHIMGARIARPRTTSSSVMATAAPTPEVCGGCVPCPILTMTLDELQAQYKADPIGTEKRIDGKLVCLTSDTPIDLVPTPWEKARRANLFFRHEDKPPYDIRFDSPAARADKFPRGRQKTVSVSGRFCVLEVVSIGGGKAIPCGTLVQLVDDGTGDHNP